MRDIITSCCVSCLALLCVISPSVGKESQDDIPNLLFILSEDLGGQLGCLGTPQLQTPRIDELARSGILCREAFVNYPVCSASKAVLYTGLYPHTNGVMQNTVNFFKPASELTAAEKNNDLYNRIRVPDQYPTLIEKLKSAGFYLGVTSKVHIGPNEKFPFDFYSKATNADVFRQFLNDAQQTKQPWFLMYNISETHRPWRNGDQVKLTVDPELVELPPFLPDTPACRQDWAEYLDSIEICDRMVGSLLDALDASGERDETMIVFMGDHGPCYQRGKVCPYDFGLRVPLIVSGPGILAGRVTDALINEVDLMPTFLDLLKIARPSLEHGVSLKPLWTGESEKSGNDYVIGEVHHGVQQNVPGMKERAIYDGSFQLIYRENTNRLRSVNDDLIQFERWQNRVYREIVARKLEFPEAFRILSEIDNIKLKGKVKPMELYDLSKDPWEMHDLVDDPQYDEHQQRLKAALVDWVHRTKDTTIKLGN